MNLNPKFTILLALFLVSTKNMFHYLLNAILYSPVHTYTSYFWIAGELAVYSNENNEFEQKAEGQEINALSIKM